MPDPKPHQATGHILFVTGEYPPMSGGVGAYTAHVAAGLAARGWRVSVLTSPAGIGDAASSTEANAVTVYPVIQKWGWNVLRDGLKWATQIGADWLHVQYQTGAFARHAAINVAPWWWRRFGQRHGLRVAWTYHDIRVPYFFPKAGDRLRRWVTDLPARVCDLAIATNLGDQEHLAPLARNLVTIPIGSNIPTHLFTPEARAARRAARGYTDNDVVIGYFGFLNRTKGVLDLVATAARLLSDVPTLRLLMIGEQVGASDATNQAYWQQVKTAIREQGLADRVIWTGLLADDEVSADLSACDLLVLLYSDGASLRRGTLMAGLAHGCAIVTTTPDAPIPELVDGRDLIYVPPGELDATVAAVRRVATDAQLRATLGRNAQAASATFSWEGIAAAHEQSYWAATRTVSSTTPPSGNG